MCIRDRIQIDDITQQNAALVEQAAAAAASLAQQTECVAQAMAVFKLRELAALPMPPGLERGRPPGGRPAGAPSRLAAPSRAGVRQLA